MVNPASTPTTYPDLRWSCTCGRFIAQSAIREQDFRDDSYYYGIRTETEFDCSRCGTQTGVPRLVEVCELTSKRGVQDA